jgi:DNA-binding LacI/PurR family transcriptional regulator
MGAAMTPIPTSTDVARLAGVSRATVSYVLNETDGGRISEQTKARVRAAAEQLGYIPHAAARSLRAGRTGIVLLPAMAAPIGPLFSQFLAELQSALRAHGYTTVLYGNGDVCDGTGTERGLAAARAWAELRPVAVLATGWAGSLPASAVQLLKRSGTQAVVCLGGRPVTGAHSVVVDQQEIGARAVEHLRERGRRRVGAVVPLDPALDEYSLPRLAGALSVDPAVRRLDLEWSEESAAALAARWPELGLDAVFAYNDEFAMLLSRALQDAGRRIPEDVAVVGADDLMLGRLLRPRLTTVHVRLPSGAWLAELIDRSVREPRLVVETHYVTGTHVVPRQSS